MSAPIPFGPQLVGQTEKTLSALLMRSLHPTGLTERQWVALRVASLTGGGADAEELVRLVADQARFVDAAALVDELDVRGLVRGGRVTAAGTALLESVLTSSAELTGPIWEGYAPADLDAATRVLNELLERARVVLASSATA